MYITTAKKKKKILLILPPLNTWLVTLCFDPLKILVSLMYPSPVRFVLTCSKRCLHLPSILCLDRIRMPMMIKMSGQKSL